MTFNTLTCVDVGREILELIILPSVVHDKPSKYPIIFLPKIFGIIP